MISMRKIFALFAKDMKSITYNVFIISGILLMPIIAIMFTIGLDEPNVWLADFLIKMNILINGANIICVMIAEEKEKHTLSVLISSTVSGADFLIGKVLVTGILTFASNLVLYFIMSLGSVIPIGAYLLMTGMAILPVTALGAIIGLVFKTQAAASTAVAPIMMLLVFVPMFLPPDNIFIDNVFKYIFSEQMSLGLTAVYNGDAYLSNLAIISANFIILATTFALIYKKRGLAT